ncbi:MAG: hypothetical protein ACRC2T_02965 [Thermoguttaceae bacterium]
MRFIYKISFVFCFLLILFTGCKRDGLIPVSGNVTLDGVPIKNGTISFLPSGLTGNSAAAEIVDGKYSTRVSGGEMFVRFSSLREPTPEEIQERKDNPMFERSMSPVDGKIEAIPAKFNSQSTMKTNITGPNKDLNFDLNTNE